MEPKALQNFLDAHDRWMKGLEGGKQADLRGADLSGADLRGADLRGADLSGVMFDGTTMIPTGETWKTYLDEVVPLLLVAGGKTIEQILATGAWECHDWSNCPMAEAFSVDRPDFPILLKPRIKQFVQFFDAGLIPKPVVADAIPSSQLTAP